jgi:hypothetical protein
LLFDGPSPYEIITFEKSFGVKNTPSFSFCAFDEERMQMNKIVGMIYDLFMTLKIEVKWRGLYEWHAKSSVHGSP